VRPGSADGRSGAQQAYRKIATAVSCGAGATARAVGDAAAPCQAGTGSRSARRRILPMLDFGKGSSRNSMILGTL